MKEIHIVSMQIAESLSNPSKIHKELPAPWQAIKQVHLAPLKTQVKARR
jgi:hypothetical protein